MGYLLEDISWVSLAGKGSVLDALRSVCDGSWATAKRTVRRFASGVHCWSRLKRHYRCTDGWLLAQQDLKKSTDIHIIIKCRFQCKISRLLLTHVQHTWGHNPSKQSWPSHADIAYYNIRKKINNPLAFATLSTCATFWTSRLILKKNENRKSKASIMNPLTHLSFLSIGMWNNFTLCGGTEEQRCLSEENLGQCFHFSWAVTAAI